VSFTKATRVIPIRRGKMFLLALGAFAFVAVCPLLINSRDLAEQKIGWMGAVFFGAIGLLWLVQLLPGASSLTLDAEGFTVRALFRDRAKIRWRDVTGFSVWTINRAKVVGYNYVHSYPGKKTSRALAQAFGAPDGTLGNHYQFGCEELAALLERWRTPG
jgi:hypothetical protein